MTAIPDNELEIQDAGANLCLYKIIFASKSVGRVRGGAPDQTCLAQARLNTDLARARTPCGKEAVGELAVRPELLQLLNEFQVEYLIVGGFAGSGT